MTRRDRPSGWQVLALGTIANPRLGGNYRNSSTPSARPLIKMGNIARVSIDLTRLDYIVPSEQTLPEHRLHYGDVLLNTRNTLDLVGKVSIWRDELPLAYYNSNILRLEFTEPYCGSSGYFGYALNAQRSIDAIRALATGTTSVAAIYTRDLLKLTVLVPPKAEQLRIASALADCDDLIASLKRTITKKEAIKHGMMQALLTGKTRLPGFTREWKPRRLSELLRYEQPGPFLVRTTTQLGNGRIPVLTAGKTFLLGYTNESTGIYRAHPIVIFDDFTTASQFVAFDFKAKSSAIKILSARPDANIRFLYERMQLIRWPLGDHKRYWISEYSQQTIDVPHPVEQDAIAEVLQECADEIMTLDLRLIKARAVKQGMMQELLTGRTRLPIMEQVAA